jgi:UDP-N-acetylglucosamine:LPS N-acetylglucosamine transferase
VGAAFLVPQGSDSGERLAKVIREAVTDPARIDRMEEAVTAFYRPNAARDIVESLKNA